MPNEVQSPANMDLSAKEMTDLGFVVVQYLGPRAVRAAPSPTGLLRERFQLRNYGLVSRGAILWVLKEDAEALKTLYKKQRKPRTPKKKADEESKADND